MGSDGVSKHIGWASPNHPADMVDLATLAGLMNTRSDFGCNTLTSMLRTTAVTTGFFIATIYVHVYDDDNEFHDEIYASLPVILLFICQLTKESM
jgi:hypothetical protein